MRSGSARAASQPPVPVGAYLQTGPETLHRPRKKSSKIKIAEILVIVKNHAAVGERSVHVVYMLSHEVEAKRDGVRWLVAVGSSSR